VLRLGTRRAKVQVGGVGRGAQRAVRSKDSPQLLRVAMAHGSVWMVLAHEVAKGALDLLGRCPGKDAKNGIRVT